MNRCNGEKETDLVIDVDQIKNKILPKMEAVILRTQNHFEELAYKTYYNTNWPYLKEETANLEILGYNIY